MKKLALLVGCTLFSFVSAEVPETFLTELGALVPSLEAGIAVGYLDEGEESSYFLGRPAFTDTTLFEYGSLTKVLTTVVLAELAAEGAVSLSESINTYLPETSRDAKWDDVTLQSLATHTSGLPSLPPSMDEAFLQLEGDNPYANFTEDDLFAALAEVTPNPDQGPLYSNFGFGLLGTLLARAAGMPYEDLVQTRILEPLEMSSTTLSSWSSNDVALPQTVQGTEATAWDFEVLAPAGAARGDLRDALRFLEASQAACTEATPLAEANCTAQAATEIQLSQFARQGLGWIRSEGAVGEIVWHNGGTGGYSSFLGFNVETGKGLVLLANVGGITNDLTAKALEFLTQP